MTESVTSPSSAAPDAQKRRISLILDAKRELLAAYKGEKTKVAKDIQTLENLSEKGEVFIPDGMTLLSENTLRLYPSLDKSRSSQNSQSQRIVPIVLDHQAPVEEIPLPAISDNVPMNKPTSGQQDVISVERWPELGGSQRVESQNQVSRAESSEVFEPVSPIELQESSEILNDEMDEADDAHENLSFDVPSSLIPMLASQHQTPAPTALADPAVVDIVRNVANIAKDDHELSQLVREFQEHNEDERIEREVLRSQLGSAQILVDKLQGDHNSLRNEFKTIEQQLREEIKQLRDGRADAEKKLAVATVRLDEQAQLIATMKSEAKQLKKEKKELSTELASFCEKVGNYEGRISELVAQKSSMAEQLRGKELADKEVGAKSSNSKELQELTDHLATARDAEKRLAFELKMTASRNEQLEQKATALESKLTTQTERFTTALASKEAEIAAFKAQIHELDKSKADLLQMNRDFLANIHRAVIERSVAPNPVIAEKPSAPLAAEANTVPVAVIESSNNNTTGKVTEETAAMPPPSQGSQQRPRRGRKPAEAEASPIASDPAHVVDQSSKLGSNAAITIDLAGDGDATGDKKNTRRSLSKAAVEDIGAGNDGAEKKEKKERKNKKDEEKAAADSKDVTEEITKKKKKEKKKATEKPVEPEADDVEKQSGDGKKAYEEEEKAEDGKTRKNKRKRGEVEPDKSVDGGVDAGQKAEGHEGDNEQSAKPAKKIRKSKSKKDEAVAESVPSDDDVVVVSSQVKPVEPDQSKTKASRKRKSDDDELGEKDAVVTPSKRQKTVGKPTGSQFDAAVPDKIESTKSAEIDKTGEKNVNVAGNGKVIAFSGFHDEEETAGLVQIVESLGATVIIGAEPNPKMTHLIVKKERARTLKILTAAVLGTWVVEEDWLKASHSAKKWLSESQYGGIRSTNNILANSKIFCSDALKSAEKSPYKSLSRLCDVADARMIDDVAVADIIVLAESEDEKSWSGRMPTVRSQQVKFYKFNDLLDNILSGVMPSSRKKEIGVPAVVAKIVDTPVKSGDQIENRSHKNSKHEEKDNSDEPEVVNAGTGDSNSPLDKRKRRINLSKASL